LGDKITIEEKKELEEFKIKILNSSYDTLSNAILYKDENCAENKKIEGLKYDDFTKSYIFYLEMKRNEKKKLSVIQEDYLCESFIIEQSNQNIKNIRLKINCNTQPSNNECLVKE